MEDTVEETWDFISPSAKPKKLAGASWRRELTAGKHLDMGIRSFFGGYDPDRRDDYANLIFFNSAVARFAW